MAEKLGKQKFAHIYGQPDTGKTILVIELLENFYTELNLGYFTYDSEFI
jgi:KaiC/GvpD/RAD55 family RecA-like ATPase